MRTDGENTTPVLHTLGVQFLDLFTFRAVPKRNGEQRKSRKTNAFKDGVERATSLDLGRFTKVTPAFFLVPFQGVERCIGIPVDQALHGFCTLSAGGQA